MAFVLRTVSHSAEGREIVRSARVEGDRLTIGRTPESDIQLSDLAVALTHAVITRDGDRLSVAVEPGLSLQLDGRKSDGGTIQAASGGDIQIASHIVRILPTAAGASEIALSIERVLEGEATLSRSADRLFSLGSVLPGRRPVSWILVIALLAIFLAWPLLGSRSADPHEGLRADASWSSGKLSRAHAALEKDCTACHAKPFEAVRDTACVACHTQVHDHADPFRLARAQPGLSTWGRLKLAVKERLNLPAGRCVECHTEHEGPQTMPATAQRFCADCHGGLNDRLPDTRLADAGDFENAHPEFQPLFVGGWQGPRPMMRRASLAARPFEDNGLKFPHDLHLAPVGGVAQMARRLAPAHGFGRQLACKDCHVPVADGTRFQPVDMERNCAMCHSLAFDNAGGTVRTLRHGEPAQVVADLRDFYRIRSPARPPSLAPFARRRPGEGEAVEARREFSAGASQSGAQAAIRAVFSKGGACFDCHRIDAPAGGSLAFRVRPVAFPSRYMHHGWFDHRDHETQDCTSCHAAGTSDSASDLLLPGIATCRTCHGGETTAKPVASSCAMCHDYHMDQGAPSRPGRDRRDQAPEPMAALRREAR